MRHLTALTLTFLAFALSGCFSSMNPQTQQASTEWRLKSLEESFLNFREEQKRQAEEIAKLRQDVQRAMLGKGAEAEVLGEKDLEGPVLAGPEGEAVIADAPVMPAPVVPMVEAPAVPAPDALQPKVDAPAANDGMAVAPAPAPKVQAPKVDKDGWVQDMKPGDDGWLEINPDANGTGLAVKIEGNNGVAQSAEPKPWDDIPTKKAPKEADKPAVPVQPSVQPAPKPAPAPIAQMGAQAMYDQAMTFYRSKEYDTARTAFSEFLRLHPKDKLSGNAQYWIGETYYSQKNYPRAILAFKDVAANYPKHSKVPAAMLKTGMSFQKVGDADNARFYLNTLVQEYPKSEPAGIARKQLAAMTN